MRLDAGVRLMRLRAQQRGRHDVAREVRGGNSALLEGFQPAHASFARSRGSKPALRALPQRLCRRAMLQSTASDLLSHFTSYRRTKPLKSTGTTRPDEARRLATGDVGPMSVVRHRSRESNRSRVTEGRLPVASSHPPDPPTSPSVCRALRRHCRNADAPVQFRPTLRPKDTQ